MILSLLSREPVVVKLPANFNLTTMRHFIADAVDKQAATRASQIYFDFSGLQWIEPVGVAVLANTIEHFKQIKVRVFFRNHKLAQSGNIYLDDSGFFEHYVGHKSFLGSKVRPTTVPLELFTATNYIPYLYTKLTPWIGQSVNLSEDTLQTIRACLEEVFHNIEYHSGVNTGCVYAQHFPKSNKICIAISDFGIGIPSRIRTKEPDITDVETLRLAVKEGYTTKTNVRNRGVGLSTLIKYITQRNSGSVLIHSGYGYLSATRGPATPNITSRGSQWVYPGTLVHVVLRTDTLERLEDDIIQEDFQW